MTEGPPAPVGADFDWCHDVVQEVSRTFAITIAELEDPLSREICVGYLLCRVADTIEDAEHIPPAAQTSLLESYRRTLDPDGACDPDGFLGEVSPWVPAAPSPPWRVVEGTGRVVRAFRALSEESRRDIRPHVVEMIDGMALFIERYAEAGGLRIRTMAELEEYCWYAAGTVGHLVTGLIARDEPEVRRETLYDTAASFGLLLQLVNVAKDVATDYETENNVYVPADLLAEHGLSSADIGTVDGERFAPVVTELVSRADGYAAPARRWLDTMPIVRGNSLSAWAIPYLLAIGTLRELRSRPADVITDGDVKVGRSEVLGLVDAFAGDGTPPLNDLQRRMRTGAFARSDSTSR